MKTKSAIRFFVARYTRPLNKLTQPLYLYKYAFGDSQVPGTSGLSMGYASALAWILFVIILLITLIQLRLSRRWVHYGS